MKIKNQIRPGDAEKTERLRAAWRLFRRDVSIADIAKALKINTQAAYKLITQQRENYRQEARQDTAAWITDAIAEIRDVKQAALLEWFASKKDKQTIERIELIGGKSRTKRRSEGQCGDPKYLMVYLDCIRKEGELRGVYRTDINLTQNVVSITQGQTTEEITKAMDASILAPSLVYRDLREDQTDEPKAIGVDPKPLLNGNANGNGHDSHQQTTNGKQ
jgi:transposase-like protein